LQQKGKRFLVSFRTRFSLSQTLDADCQDLPFLGWKRPVSYYTDDPQELYRKLSSRGVKIYEPKITDLEKPESELVRQLTPVFAEATEQKGDTQ